jgi:NAD(P)-dependent dehydrogenase (short-subunit alcohol dehydrogenase family)
VTAPTGTRVSLVIGGVKGIGAATSRKLAGEGPVFATYLRDEVAAAAFQAQAERDDLPIRTLQADVRTRAAVEALVKSVVEEAGGIDVAVFAAVSALLKSPLLLSEEGWSDVLNTNTAPFLWLGQQMANVGRERGRLIALTSPWSHRYVEGYGAIGPSKAALESLVVYLAAELASRGTTVNAVSGGLVNTALLRSLVPAKEIAAVVKKTPLGRIGEPEDIASAVSWLASEASGWMTGQVVTLDGGYFLR